MICPHPRFLELHTDVQASSELVTARCRDCRHVWTIADAQHCAKGERPRTDPLYLANLAECVGVVPGVAR